MQYTKPMIDLVLLIRKTAPSDIKPQIKLANPDLLDKLVKIYPTLEERLLRSLVFELMVMAGPNWAAALKERAGAALTGSASNQPSPASTKVARATPSSRTRIYRGQVIPATG